MIYQWFSEAKLSGRVRDKTGKEQIAKQLSSMDDMPRFDMETGDWPNQIEKGEEGEITTGQSHCRCESTGEKASWYVLLCAMFTLIVQIYLFETIIFHHHNYHM